MILSRQVLVIQHTPFETPGLIGQALLQRGFSLQTIHSASGDSVPERCDEAAALVVMGGPMGVYQRDRFPFLADEIRLIERTLSVGRPVLGVCLGSQLLAAALGARVKKGPKKEIGWFPVTLTAEGRGDALWSGVAPSLHAFHWHGDIFDLPKGAVSLASSERTACQAFRVGQRAYGLLFHAEVTRDIIQGMVQAFHDELREEGLDGKEILQETTRKLPGSTSIARDIFSRWAGSI